jgi:mycothiol synthase
MITIRKYRPSDLASFQGLYLKSLGTNPSLRRKHLKTLERHMSKPGHSPEEDLLLAFWGDKPAGFLDCIPEDIIGRVILLGFVLPDFRRRGIAGALIDRAEELARLSGRKLFHICLNEREKGGAAFLETKSFSRARTFLDLVLDLQRLPEKALGESVLELKALRRGGESLLAEVQNRIFEDTWGYCPNTAEDIRFYLLWTGSRIDDVLVHMIGNDVAGYVWTHPVHTEAEGRVRIHMLGVQPRFRGRGLGKALLTSILRQLKGKGLYEVELTVDSENAAALHLYDSLGFRLRNRLVWFEKKIV